MNSRMPFLSMDCEKAITSDPLVKIKILVTDYKTKEIELETFKNKAFTMIAHAIKQGAEYYALKQCLGEYEFGLINTVVRSDENNEKFKKIKFQMAQKETEKKLDPKREELIALGNKLKLFLSTNNLHTLMTDSNEKKNEALIINKLDEYQASGGNVSELVEVIPIGTLLRFFYAKKEDKKANNEQTKPVIDPNAAAVFNAMDSFLNTTPKINL